MVVGGGGVSSPFPLKRAVSLIYEKLNLGILLVNDKSSLEL